MKIEGNLLIVYGTRVPLCLIRAYERRYRDSARNHFDKPDSFHYLRIQMALGEEIELNVPGFLIEEQSKNVDLVMDLLDEYFQKPSTVKGEHNHD